MCNLMENLNLKRKELNIQSDSSDKLCYLRKIEKRIASFKEASIKKQKKINYEFIKKEYKTVIGTKFIISESFLSEAPSCFEREYIEEKNKKQKLKDKEFRVDYLRKYFGKKFNSQKIEILMEYNVLILDFFILCEQNLIYLKKDLKKFLDYFYSLKEVKSHLLMPSIAIEENRVLLN